MDNFKITKTILENINEQNDRINECIDIVNGFTTDEETKNQLVVYLKENKASVRMVNMFVNQFFDRLLTE